MHELIFCSGSFETFFRDEQWISRVVDIRQDLDGNEGVPYLGSGRKLVQTGEVVDDLISLWYLLEGNLLHMQNIY